MLVNYLKIGFRNLLKNRLFSLINISGMAISITIFMVIALFLTDELKFDRDLKDVSMKFRVYSNIFYDDGRIDKGAMIPPPVAPALASEFPEVEYYTRFLNFNSRVLFEAGDKKLTENGGGYADHTIFSMFALHLVEGDSATALTTPGSVAISQTLAKKIFGTEPALGKIIEVLNSPYSVSAVFSDFPVHSHLHLNYLLPMVEFTAGNKEGMESRSWNQFHTYIKLKPGADRRQLEAKLMDFAERFAKPSKNPRIKFDTYHLMPVDDIYLQAYDQKWDIGARGNAQTVYILSATAGFILLIAILNFINLSTARAVNRVKEVGVRKVMGAFRRQLVGQFISESVLLAFIALVIAGTIAEVLLPSLNSFTGKNIPTQLFFNPAILALMGLSGLVIGIAAGVYPAFYVSHGKPAEILSGKNQGKLSGRTLLRKVLVVFQFMLSFALITGSLIVTGQNTYLRTRDMGFDQQNLVVLPLRDELRKNLEFTKNSFMAHPNVLSATLGYGLPGQAFAGDGVKDMVTRKNYSVSMLTVDDDYIKTLGLTVVAGRDFSTDFPSDEMNAFILSETAVKMFGHTSPEQAIGHELEWDRWDNHDSLKVGKVVGVVKDIHLNSLRENVTPVILHIFPFAYSTITLRIKNEDIPATIAYLEQTWKQFNSEWPFEYKFLDENFDRLYKSEEKLATLFTFFTIFAIFVACLGLFGLVVFSTTQKYREISIRKVLGASEASLVIQLASSYVALIAIAFVIAAPLAYMAAENWLQGFAYHIDVSPFLLLKAALSILVVSILTVGIQSFRAARANPVEALRRE